MPDKKLTDLEIVKALKELLEIMLVEGDLQRSATISNVLDLINCLQAKNEEKQQFIDHLEAENYVLMEDKEKLKVENERLQKNFEEASNDRFIYKIRWAKAEARESKAKAEAYKEFAERLKETFPQDDFLRSTKRISEDIDNLAKEMVGEDK